MRIARDAHTPDLTLGEVGDLLFTAIEVFVGHAFERPMVLSELSRNLEMPRNTVRRKLQRLIEISLVECIDHRYYMMAKANAPQNCANSKTHEDESASRSPRAPTCPWRRR
jgi:IclR helix-turn-helix domain